MDTNPKCGIPLAVRDSSLALVDCSTFQLPELLPLNVQDIPQQVLTQDELAITSLDVGQITQYIRTGKLSCEQTVMAFLRRAALGQQLINCVTELLPDYAISRARYLDSLSEPCGPLHGVPVSIKEQFGFNSKLNNNAFVAWAERPQGPHCSLQRYLERAGAIVFARTTQPQTAMHLETNSVVYGRTVNPWNRSLTSGGSSGGEGALVGFRGSPLGIGGDIGGSIRCPAANCGVYGFKPSPFRIGNTGTMGTMPGQDGINGCLGPISTSLEGLELFMQAYLAQSPWIEDPSLIPLPWRQIELPSKLKIVVMWSDGIVEPHPPIKRALQTVAQLLKKDFGFTIVDWTPEKHDECWGITSALYFEDGGDGVRDILAQANEPRLPLTEWILGLDTVRHRTVEEIRILKTRRNAYRAMYNDLWLSTGKEDGHIVDAILCPVGPGCAPPHDQAKYWSYTSQWNLLEYPAVAFPMTHVDHELDARNAGYAPRNADDRFNYELYTGPERYKDAPVSLQVVTRRYEDEKCLAVLKEIERVVTKSLRPDINR